MSLPRTQVAMTKNSAAPMTRGRAAPERIFSELAPRKNRSMVRSGAIRAKAPASGHFHILRTTMKAREVVTAMVPVTARP